MQNWTRSENFDIYFCVNFDHYCLMIFDNRDFEIFFLFPNIFEVCSVPVLTYETEAWGYIKKEETKGIERIQGKALKKIFQLPVSTSYIEILMKTGRWPAEQRIKYATLMLYHNVKSSDEGRKIKKMIGEQEKGDYNNTFYKKNPLNTWRLK